ncbi:DUF4956 domain-containing protein [Desulfovibrio sp. UCD-KL4C]|uniref:DUF4956 domain-containing protein n=1 Tax=Desulfovibrio sp. UCD-KL4C TaxID=2578120 RepID=UPI0025C4C1DE|nr:DUF4956 domain-containing protein [Desulfovibrio sp. UCD-KL4C]
MIKSIKKYIFPINCVVAALSVSSSFAINSALKHSNLPRLLQTLPIGVAVGVVLGIIYFWGLKKALSKIDDKSAEELKSGIMWFNFSMISLWAVVLPLPAGYLDFVVGFIFSGGCARFAGAVYTVFGSSMSNRKRFANTFVILTVTIMLVISVVKASLALSLGLVGALSIIRFRTAVKEPEELAFLFFTIAVGLGFGAGKIGITLIAFWAICIGFILFKKIIPAQTIDSSYLVTVYSSETNILNSVKQFLSTNNLSYEFTRLESSPEMKNFSFLVNINSLDILSTIDQYFLKENLDASVTVVQTRDLY